MAHTGTLKRKQQTERQKTMLKTLINWITTDAPTTADVVRNARGGYSIEITTNAKKTRVGNYPTRADAERVCRWNGYERKPHQ